MTAPAAPPRALVAKVRRFIKDGALVVRGDRVLVGVSGGADSTALLLTLCSLRRSLGIDVEAAHFDHGLSPAATAAAELRAVRSLSNQLGVRLHTGAGNVRAHAKSKKLSIEEAARVLRYRFLARTAAAGCDTVAVGHTKDDQAETVLLHIIRGSGLRGLAAMAADASWPLRLKSAPRLVRPLLAVTRAETERCCAHAGVVPIKDPSNQSPAHLRNRIRSELTPLLRSYNPRIAGALARLADAAALDVDALESLAAEALLKHRGPDARLSRQRLSAMPESLRRHAVRLAVTQATGDARGLAERHIAAVVRAAAGPTGARLDLPRGLTARVTRTAVELTTERPARPRTLPKRPATLPVPGEAKLGPWRFRAQLLRKKPADLTSGGDACIALLDADACGKNLTLRGRRHGDRFHPLGLRSEKKLQDVLVDAHVPRQERDGLPLVLAKRGIAWVASQRPAEWAKVTPETKRVLRVTAARSPA